MYCMRVDLPPGPEERYKKVSLFEATATRQLQTLLRELADTVKNKSDEVSNEDENTLKLGQW